MICLFGGTFDPVHCGHIHGAIAVCDALRLAELRMVLSARPGHREPPGAPAADRWQMLRLACAEDPRLVADDRELNRAAPSYTVETLAALRGQMGSSVIIWVLGSDAFADLPSWHRWTEVLELANLVILQRPGQLLAPEQQLSAPLAAICAQHRVDHPPDRESGQIMFLRDEMQSISASQVRAALATGQTAAHLLPDRVATYINHHGLYGELRDL
ncbi:MAG: nicotinate-nucleotide adenylyltransferase [Gammaproteobacteria bacterium]|nr:nicotinate-nucleotide adenylyltransferase [Gammaproteobacteria bacterium]